MVERSIYLTDGAILARKPVLASQFSAVSRSFQNRTDYFGRLVKRGAGFCLGSGAAAKHGVMAVGVEAKDDFGLGWFFRWRSRRATVGEESSGQKVKAGAQAFALINPGAGEQAAAII